MKENYVVKKVLKRTDGVKYVIIPKDCEFNAGDYIAMNKINYKEVKNGR